MTCYQFILVQNLNGIINEPQMYAFTDDISLMKEFKITRNMNFFLLKEVDIPKRIYQKFQDKYRGHKLTRTKFKTRNTNEIPTYTSVYTVCTGIEEQSVFIKADRSLLEIGKYTESLGFLKQEYLLALTVYSYFKIYNFTNANTHSFYGNCGTFFEDELKFEYDEFSLFLFFFGYTMKNDKP